MRAPVPLFPSLRVDIYPAGPKENCEIIQLIAEHCQWTGSFEQVLPALRGDKEFKGHILQIRSSYFVKGACEAQQDSKLEVSLCTGLVKHSGRHVLAGVRAPLQ